MNYPDYLTFDKVCDICEVDQVGFLDLADAYSKGSVSGDFAVTTSESFNEASPDTLMNRPHDQFEALRQRDYVRGVLSAKSSEESKTE